MDYGGWATNYSIIYMASQSLIGVRRQSVSIICRLRTADCRPDWVQNSDWGYKMQTEDKMQTGGELGIFYKFPPSHSHVIVLVDILMLKLVTFIKMDEEDSDVEVLILYEYLYYSHSTVKLDNFNTFLYV